MQMAAKTKVGHAVVLAIVFALIATLFTSPADAGPPPPPGSTPSSTDVACSTIFAQPAAPSAPVSQKHCDALEALYYGLDGSNWPDRWPISSNDPIDPCTSFPGVWCHPVDGITRLDLASQSLLGALPSEIGDLEALTWLGLSGNSITSVPASIGNLHRLTRLTLSANNIAVLPDTFGSLTSVTYLSLGHNDLAVLPASIGSMSSLNHLEVSGNNLTSLPPELTQLSNLTTFDLSHNELVALPDMAGYPHLEFLLLGNNQIDATAHDVFTTLSQQTPYVTHVDLEQNQIGGTIPDAIMSMSVLGFLGLDGNRCLDANDEVTAFMSVLWTVKGPDTGADVLRDDCASIFLHYEPPVRVAPWQDPRDPLGPIVREPVAAPVLRQPVAGEFGMRVRIGR